MLNPWATEFWRISGLVFAALTIGFLSGHIILVLFLATAGYLIWHLIQLSRLESWLRQGSIPKPVTGKGIWNEIYYNFYRIRQRNRKQKRKLADVIHRFRESAAAMPDATVILRTNGEIDWFNESASQLLGLRSPHDIGQRLINLVRHPDFIRYLEEAQYSRSLEFPSPVKEQVMLEINIVPYGKDERLLIARDVTRIKRLEQIRRDFVANVSHELRTPLTVLNGFLETMSDSSDNEPIKQWKRSLHLMQQQTTRMQYIVDDLLLLSRLETDDKNRIKEPVSVPAMLAAIREEAITLSGNQEHDVQLIADQRLWLFGNEKELRSAFSNLVANAVLYTPAKGKITLHWFSDNSGAHFEVRDTGIGIAPQHISRLTERFYRVDTGRSRETGGTGLGLAIVKHALERHSATLRIESTLNVGSTFTCDFPLTLIYYKEQTNSRIAPNET